MQIESGEINQLLKNTPLFGYLDDQVVQLLGSHFHSQLLPKGQEVFNIGEPSDSFYLIVEGSVDLEDSGRFTNLQRGDYFGEEALLADDPRFYKAVTHTKTFLLRLDVVDFLPIYDQIPGIEDYLEVSVHSRKLAMQVSLPWLSQDEVIYVIARRHPAILGARLFIPLAFGFSMFFFALLLQLRWLPESLLGWITLGIGLPLCVGWLLWAYMDWRNDYFLVTNKRVVWIEKIALIYESRQEAPLSTIMSVGIQKSRIGSLLGYADVVVLTYVGTIRFQDLRQAAVVGNFIESYWRRSKTVDQREEARIMEAKLRQKLNLPNNGSEETQPLIREKPSADNESKEREPGFFEWLLSDFLRLRFESGGEITYRKHWFSLVRRIWIPFILMSLMIVALAGRLSGALAFLSIGSSLLIIFSVIFIVFLWMLYEYVDWRNDIFKVTFDQVVDIDKKPLGRIRRRSAPLENVLSIEYERQGFWEYLLNFGTVYISVGNTKLSFNEVYNPSEVQQDVFYRMGERLEQIRRFEIESERERLSEWIANYHRKSDAFRKLEKNRPDDEPY